MRVLIEVKDEAELRRVAAILREEGVEVRVGGDGGPPSAASDPEKRRDELRRLFGAFQGVLAPGYTFDRDELHDRRG